MAEDAAGAPPGDGAAPPAAEETPFDFAGVYGRVRHKPCAVAGVKLVGNKRTKDHIILREVTPVRERGVDRMCA
jgi:hypothetical protein